MTRRSSWKTTVGGISTAVGAALLAAASGDGAPAWLHQVGVACSVFGPALLGISARDNKVSSEESGAKNP